jgi:hypothetical protein
LFLGLVEALAAMFQPVAATMPSRLFGNRINNCWFGAV